MTSWSRQQRAAIGASGEVGIAPLAADGSLRPYTTIWVVRVDDDLYVRSYRGVRGGWYRQAAGSRHGRIRAGQLEADVAFEQAADADASRIDEAYRTKYARHARTFVGPMISPQAAAATLRLVPAGLAVSAEPGSVPLARSRKDYSGVQARKEHYQ